MSQALPDDGADAAPDIDRRVIAAARAAIGTPFRAQGRDAGDAMDCLGLIAHVAAALGRTVDIPPYALIGRHDSLERGLVDHGLIRVPAADAMPGDVLVLALDAEQRHLALKTERGVIHAHRGLGRVVEHRLPMSWRRLICGVYRFPRS